MASEPVSSDRRSADDPSPASSGPRRGPTVEPEPPPPPRSEGSVPWRLFGVVQTVRPHQWVKNVFVLAPVLFAREIFDPLLLYRAFGAFGVFCLLAGAVYTINDIADRNADAQHPVKRFRPIASGRVPISMAKSLAVVLVALALALASLGPPAFLIVALSYFVMNLVYSFRLKKVAYVDVGIISAGFVLRVMGGGYATYIQVSVYLLACTALLALFLGFGKRRHEIGAAASNAKKQRAALEAYSRRGLDVALVVTGALTLATYLAYTLDAKTREFFRSDWLWPSAVLVAAAMFRFITLVRTRPDSESPTQEMLKDGPFVGIVLFWVFLVMWIVYHLRPS